MSSDCILLVRILRGERLVAKDSDGYSDPYLEIKCGKKKYVSSVCKKTLNPDWNEVIEIPKPSKKDELKVICWDKDRFRKEFMGQFNVILSGFIDFDGGKVLVEGEKTFNLEPKKEGKGRTDLGSISLEFRVVTKEELSELKALRAKSNKGELDDAGIKDKLNKWIPQRPDKGQLVKMGIIKGEDDDSMDGSGKGKKEKRAGKRSKKSSKKEESVTATPVFGIPLSEVMEGQRDRFPDLDVPWVVKQCVELLIADPFTYSENGVFRLSGSKEAVQKAKADLNAGKLPDLESLSRDDLASLLKDWIRELPDPLFTLALKSEWLEIANEHEDDPAYLEALIRVFQRLPEENRAVWICLGNLFVKIAEAEATTMMGPSNIGIVIGPNVLWEAGPVPMPIMAMSHIVAQMVIHHNDLLNSQRSASTPSACATTSAQSEASSSQDHAYISSWSISQVSDWLRSYGWDEYIDSFTENQIDGQALLNMTLDDYLHKLNVISLGHRKKMSFRVSDCLEQERAKS